MDNELLEAEKNGLWVDSSNCSCAMRNTHGLACGCLMALKERESDVFYSDEIHPFWQTMSLAEPVDKVATDRDS